MVTTDPDHALDEVLVARGGHAKRGAHLVEEPSDRVARRVRAEFGTVLPRRGSPEYDDLATVGFPEPVDELVDQNPVTAAAGTAVQRPLHRRGRNEEGLDQERLDQQRQDQSDQDQKRQLPPESALASLGRVVR